MAHEKLIKLHSGSEPMNSNSYGDSCLDSCAPIALVLMSITSLAY